MDIVVGVISLIANEATISVENEDHALCIYISRTEDRAGDMAVCINECRVPVLRIGNGPCRRSINALNVSLSRDPRMKLPELTGVNWVIDRTLDRHGRTCSTTCNQE